MKKDEATTDAPARTQRAEPEVQNTRLAEVLRKAELRLAIEASTARIVSLALARGSDPDLELL